MRVNDQAGRPQQQLDVVVDITSRRELQRHRGFWRKKNGLEVAFGSNTPGSGPSGMWSETKTQASIKRAAGEVCPPRKPGFSKV